MADLHQDRKSVASRIRPFTLLYLSLGLCILGGYAKAAPSSGPDSVVERELLRSMLSGLRVNLRGRQVETVSSPQNGPTRMTTRTIARSKDGRSLTRCVLPGSMRGSIKLDDGDWTRSFDPHKNAVEISRSMPRIRSEMDARRQIRRILANYSVRITGPDWMAGRPCSLLEFQPHDPAGHLLRLWVDKSTGVVLARQENDRRGETLGLSFFTTVSFPPAIPDSELSFRFPARLRREKLALTPIFREITPIRNLAGFEVHQPYCMPAGFHFDSCEIALVNRVRVACLRYTDGLDMITICESRSTTDLPAGDRAYQAQHLPRGETMVVFASHHTAFMVIGPRAPQVLTLVARALDNERERELMGQLCHRAGVPIQSLVIQRNRGIGLDDLAALLVIASRTRRRFDSIVAMHREGWCWTQIAARLRLDPAQVEAQIRPYQIR